MEDRSEPLSTIFFGGGTPSLVPPHLVRRILEAIDRHLSISAAAEISMEVSTLLLYYIDIIDGENTLT